MGPDIELALQLQTIDTRVIKLKQEITALPKHIAEIEKQLVSHQRRLETDQAALAANQKENSKLEGDIKVFEEKISHLKHQMLEAKTNEQYRAFQHEIEYCEKGISKAEDRILELMEEAETLGDAVAAAEAALKQEKEHVEREKQAARDRTASAERQLTDSLAERKSACASLNPKILASYERIRQRHGLPVLVEGADGRCTACNMTLRPQFFQELRQASEPRRCENCWRLLYYHAPVDVEAEQSQG